MTTIQSPSPLSYPSLTSRILFLWSKGSRQLLAYHITDKDFTPLPTFDSPDLQTCVCFLPKKVADVRAVEILQGVRLTGTKIERFGFSIPRNRMEFFQDDIFVPTVDTEKSVQSAGEFWQGRDVELPFLDLKPRDMTLRAPPPPSSSNPLFSLFVCFVLFSLFLLFFC